MDKGKIINDKKFMWDGKVYATKDEAEKVKATYERDNFETQLIEEEGKYLVYTRRVVTEVVVEGEPSL